MTNTITTKNGEQLARPLKILIPLIKEDLREGNVAAQQAGMQYYTAAGAKLIEAKSQIGAMSWGNWLTKNFHLSQKTAQDYMRAARKTMPASFLRPCHKLAVTHADHMNQYGRDPYMTF